MSDSELTKDQIIAQKAEIIEQQKEEIRLLKEKIDHLIRIIHSSKSEKLDANQLELLLDPDAVKKPEAADGEEEPQAAETQNKPRSSSKRQARLPANIPTVETILLPDAVKANPEAYRQVGEKRSEKLDVTPTRYTRHITIRPTFVEKGAPIPKWFTAPAPPSLLEGSILTPSLLAHILTAKYCDHLPLDRQEKIMARRHDIHIPRNTLCHWVNFAAETLNPLYQLIASQLRQRTFLNIDETPVSYLPKDAEKSGSQLGYFWIYRSNESEVLYDWQTGRSHQCLDNVLLDSAKNFKGLIQCDGYKAYETWGKKHTDITLAGCWVHARRKFTEALPYSRDAARILHYIQKLYQAEHQYKDWIAKHHHPPEVIIYYRRRHLKSLLKELRRELHTLSLQHLPASKMGKALSYTLNQWNKLCIAVKHSPTLDNNAAENAVRPLKLGAKNWLFIGNEDTGWRSAVIYTLIENIRSVGKDPYAYLKWVFEQIPHMTNQQSLDPLLPKSWLKLQSEQPQESPMHTTVCAS